LLEVILLLLLVSHGSSVTVLLSELVLLGSRLHTISSVVVADVVLSVVESVRSGLVELASILLLGLHLLLLAHAL